MGTCKNQNEFLICGLLEWELWVVHMLVITGVVKRRVCQYIFILKGLSEILSYPFVYMTLHNARSKGLLSLYLMNHTSIYMTAF